MEETMTSLAIIDLDGVIAENTERFARATKPSGGIDWSVAFDPTLVVLDTLIAGADQAVTRLENKHGYAVIFLTSRPETMREATEQ
jgi:ribonucleotide monophosphatase NagD (HAD superfamily)